MDGILMEISGQGYTNVNWVNCNFAQKITEKQKEQKELKQAHQMT